MLRYLEGVTTGCGHLTDQQSSVETFIDQGIKRCFKAGSSDQEPILAIKNFDRRRSWKYRAYCGDYPLFKSASESRDEQRVKRDSGISSQKS